MNMAMEMCLRVLRASKRTIALLICASATSIAQSNGAPPGGPPAPVKAVPIAPVPTAPNGSVAAQGKGQADGKGAPPPPIAINPAQVVPSSAANVKSGLDAVTSKYPPNTPARFSQAIRTVVDSKDAPVPFPTETCSWKKSVVKLYIHANGGSSQPIFQKSS